MNLSNITTHVNYSAAVQASLEDFITQLCLQAQAAHPDQQRLIICIVGGTASGKSFLASLCVYVASQAAHALATKLGWPAPDSSATADFAVVVPMDGYHFTNTRLIADGLRHIKGQEPTIDAESLMRDAASIAAGDDVHVPEYDRAAHDPVPAAKHIPPHTRIVFIEGLHLLRGVQDDTEAARWRGLREVAPVAVYVDTPLDECRHRVIHRKSLGGISAADAAAWFDTVDARTWHRIAEHEAHAATACAHLDTQVSHADARAESDKLVDSKCVRITGLHLHWQHATVC